MDHKTSASSRNSGKINGTSQCLRSAIMNKLWANLLYLLCNVSSILDDMHVAKHHFQPMLVIIHHHSSALTLQQRQQEYHHIHIHTHTFTSTIMHIHQQQLYIPTYHHGQSSNQGLFLDGLSLQIISRHSSSRCTWLYWSWPSSLGCFPW